MRAVNLIPSDERRGAAVVVGRSQGAAYGVVGLIAGLAILALMWGVADHQISSRHSEAASLSAQTARAQESASKLTPYTSFIAMQEQREQTVAQLVDSRFDWAHAFHELGRVLPVEASISSLEGTIGAQSTATTMKSSSSSSTATPAASSVTSATPPGSVPTFTLKGCATSQAAVALTLERLRLIDGVNAVSLQSSAKQSSGGPASSANASESPCGVGKPTFSAQVTFDALPTATTSSTTGTKVTTATGAGQ
jgi:Tfp pilus assembly protein PilN